MQQNNKQNKNKNANINSSQEETQTQYLTIPCVLKEKNLIFS